MNNIIEVAEKLYYEINNNINMDVPSSVYEKVELYFQEWMNSDLTLNLYGWIKQNKTLK